MKAKILRFRSEEAEKQRRRLSKLSYLVEWYATNKLALNKPAAQEYLSEYEATQLYKISRHKKLTAELKEEMEGHMKKEELILFPRIKELQKLADNENAQLQLNISYLQSPITAMEQEHDHAGNLLNDIRILSDDFVPPQDACTTYRLSFAALKAFELDLHQHVHLENNILFPKALKLEEKVKS